MLDKHSLANIAILLVALAANNAYAAYDVAENCKLVKPGTKLKSLDSCQIFFVCNVNGGYTTQTCSPDESFDKNTQQCKPSSMVNCNYGNQDPCAQTTGKAYVMNPKDCNGYVYCVNKAMVGTGTCPEGQIYKNQACIYGSCTNDKGPNSIVPVADMCEILKDGVFFGDFAHCNAWYKCVNGKKTSGKCTGSLVFNTIKGMCLSDDDNTMCSRIENPTFIPPEACGESDENSLIADKNVCSTYYKCDGKVWNKKICLDNRYFDVNQEECLPRQTATPRTGCNRCQYATTTWVNAVDTTCEGYLTCSGGNRIDNGTCGKDNYFSELRQVCIQEGNLVAYRQTNGACSENEATTTSTVTTPTTAGDDSTASGESSSDDSSSSTEPSTEKSSSSSESPDEESSSQSPDEESSSQSPDEESSSQSPDEESSSQSPDEESSSTTESTTVSETNE